MSRTVLVTGSEGLIGRALVRRLRAEGATVRGLDLRASDSSRGDVRDALRIRAAVAGCDGVVHLAAVSRVVWGEQDPALCRSTNVDGLGTVLRAALEQERRPWLVFASSREVYGQADCLPATEETPLRPMNVYGRSKVEGEEMVTAARREGLPAAIVRLSNVFGSTGDHADRVVPAFARAAVGNAPLRVDGAGNIFDFTHVDDVVRGIILLTKLLSSGQAPAPIQLVSGVPTTLGELAEMAIELAGSASQVHLRPVRGYDVSRFYGSFARAQSVLGWSPGVPIRQGVASLLQAYRIEQGSSGGRSPLR